LWVARVLDRDRAGPPFGRLERQLDRQHSVLIAGARLVGLHVGAELDRATELPALDLYLLIDVALLPYRRSAAAGENQGPALDLELEHVDIDPGQLRGHDRARRVARVRDIHRR
jgi:hypothetical protein